MSEEPFANKVGTKKFLLLYFNCERNGFRVCPQCGQVTVLDANKLNEMDMKERVDFVFDEKFRIHLGLCSDFCAKEFLGGLYNAYK